MTERDIWKSLGEKADFEGRSPLLMPVMEGNSLRSGDVAGFLKTRLSLLRETKAPLRSLRLS